jgi:hypothetical protein
MFGAMRIPSVGGLLRGRWCRTALVVAALAGLASDGLTAQDVPVRPPPAGVRTGGQGGDSLPCWDCDRARQPLPAFFEWQIGMWSAWSFNRFLREGTVGDLSLDFWRDNWRGRWDWDPNSFLVNQIGHPLQGSMYFNGYRSNGYGFWSAQAMTLVGSFVWECCGERNLPSVNDLITTWMGGASVGELSRRLSDAVLDDGARGGERVVREVAGFAANPVRGIDRLLRGHAWRPGRSPSTARPEHFVSSLSLSGLTLGNVRTADTESRSGAKLAARLEYGDPLDLGGAPFSRFVVDAEFTTIPGAPLYFVRTEGSLWGRPVKRRGGSTWMLGSFLRYDYIKSPAFELGAQSVTFGVERDGYPLRPDLRLSAGTRLRAVPIAAVEDEFQPVSDEGRDYDYSFGGGLELETMLRFRDRYTLRNRSAYTALRVIEGVAASHVIERHEYIGSAVLGTGTTIEGGIRYQTRRSHFEDGPGTRAYSPEYWIGVGISPPRWRR